MSDSQMAVFLLCPHLVDGASVIRALTPFMGLHPHHLITSQRPPPNTVTLGVRTQCTDLGVHTHQSLAGSQVS